jgi:D-serine deaminase-like pyridoxal phosphate-dependent protein/REP element-mobilizing transposase RayT
LFRISRFIFAGLQTMQAEWYKVTNVEEVCSPALLVYPDRIRENIRRMIAIAGGVDGLRPHVKTHKMAKVIRIQMEQGITKFKCATIAEAEMVAGCGAPDVLLAYQPVGPNVQRVIRLVESFPETRFSVIADDAEAIRALSAALGSARGPRAPVGGPPTGIEAQHASGYADANPLTTHPASRPAAATDTPAACAPQGFAEGARYSRRNLPHFEKPWAIYAIHFTTRSQRELSPDARQTVLDCVLHWRDRRYRLTAACVMPDHVHLIIQPGVKSTDPKGDPVFYSLTEILHTIKSYTAHKINELDNSSGPVWEKESFDRFVRSDRDLEEKFHYICRNPWDSEVVQPNEPYSWLWTPEIQMETGGARGPRAPVGGPPNGTNVEEASEYADANPVRTHPDSRPAAATDTPAACAPRGIEVLLDLDIGQHRTGVPPDSHAFDIYRLIASLPGLIPGGLHAYDGHIHDVDVKVRKTACDAAFAPVELLRRSLERDGFPVPRIVAGGTPTFPMHARRDGVECSPGTCVFWDAGYGTKLLDLDFLPAVVLLTRVVSKPTPARLCLDLGHKAVASEMPHPRVVFLNLMDATPGAHSEEHLVVETSNADAFQVGDCLYGLPWHICPTVALHSEVMVIEDGKAKQRWNVTARERRLTI